MRVLALARITFLEGIRNRSVFGILLFSLFILGLNIAIAGFFMRELGKVTVDMNLSALSFAGLLLVLFVGINLIAKDIDKKTIHLVLSKPITRIEYLWGKFLGILYFVVVSLFGLLALSCATVTLVKEMYPAYFVDFFWSVFFLAVFFIFVKLAVLTAIMVFFSSLSSNSFITLIFSISIYLVGVSIEEVVFYLRSRFAAQEIGFSDSLERLIEGVSYVVPNFSLFDFKMEAAHGLAVAWGRIGSSLGYGAVYITLLLLLASLIFSRREFN